MTGEPAGTGIGSRADVGADAALVLAAVARMQAADQQARRALERLRTGLAGMAVAIGRAKAKVADSDDGDAAAKAVDTAALLDELEHLVDRMIEIAVAESVGAAAAEAAGTDQVPTVSGVVSRLDPDQETAEPAALSIRDVAIAAAAAGPTVEMLKSLVAALNASIPAEPTPPHAGAPPAERPGSATTVAETGAAASALPDADAIAAVAEVSAPAIADAEAAAPPAAEASFEDFPAEAAITVLAEAVAAALAEPAATAPAEPAAADAPPAHGSPAHDVIIYEVELLARFEEMEAVPILPPELGTAVIFPPRHAEAAETADLPRPPQPPPPEAATAAPAAAEPLAELVAEPPAVAGTESTAIAQPEAASDDGDRTADFKPPMDLLPTVDLDIAPRTESVAPVEPTAASELAGDAAPEAATEAAAQPAEEAADEAFAAPEPAVAPDAGFDPDDFLFGSNGKTNGAGEPVAAATADSADSPANEPAAAPPSPADQAASGATGKNAAPPEAKAAADPLVPIKAMSPDERIALFS